MPDYPSSGNRNLAQSSSSWSNAYTSFNGGANTCPDIGKVLADGMQVGDTVKVRIVLKHTNIVPAEGKTAKFWPQGAGNVTAWNSGSFFNTGGARNLNGSGEIVVEATDTVQPDHLKNAYWNCNIRFDYVSSGSVQWKEWKVEIGNSFTAYTQAPEQMGWSTDTLVPTQSNRYLWKFEYIYYSDGSVKVTSPVNLSIAGANGATGPQGIQGLQGPKGDQGIAGAKGADGKTQYTHIAYADNATGGGFSQTDQTKAYIGMYVDFTATDSTDVTSYRWTKWRGSDGAQGIPGPKGADGKTPYLHIAYANSPDGVTDFSTSNSGNKRFLGTYTDYTQADSTDPTKYKWVDMVGTVRATNRNLILKSNDFSNPHKQNGANTTVTSANDYFVIKSTGYTANAWGGMSWNMSISEVKAGEEFSILMPVYIDSSVNLDNGWNFNLKNYHTNTIPYNYSIPTDKKDQWFNVAITFKAYSDVTLDAYPFFVYLVKNGLVRIKPPMLVRGNVIPSDYVVAPEDIQANIDSKADQVLTQEQLNALQEQSKLMEAELKAAATAKEVAEWVLAYKKFVDEQKASRQASEKALIDASNRVSQLEWKVGDMKQSWQFIDSYMTASNEGLIIGKDNASEYVKISSGRVSFFSGNSEVMYISQGVLNIDNGIFTKSVQIGRFRFEEHPSNQDMLVLRYIGG